MVTGRRRKRRKVLFDEGFDPAHVSRYEMLQQSSSLEEFSWRKLLCVCFKGVKCKERVFNW